MKRWLAEFRVESQLKLAEGLEELLFNHAESNFEIVIKNVSKDPEPKEILAIYTLFFADNAQIARKAADTHIHKFLHLLSFITNTGYKISRMVSLIDWSPGLAMRDMYVHTPALEAPVIPALDKTLLPTINAFYEASPNPAHERALRWFAAGVRSEIMEDQFQYFWFVIELVANSFKDASKVTDKCQKCNGDLYCQSCGQVSEHKPFPKQAISAWLGKIGVSNNHIKDLFDVRNAIMHGDTREMIEEMLAGRESKGSLIIITDAIGRMAWDSIFAHYQLKKDPGEIVFLDSGGYVRTKVSATAHIQTVVPGELKIENISLPQVSFTSRPINLNQRSAK